MTTKVAKGESSPIVVSDKDYSRIQQLIEANPSPYADALEDELSRATIVPKAPGDCVAMNSTVSFVDLDTGKDSTVKLVYPSDADVSKSRISILSPVGSALIGLPVGGHIKWPVQAGKARRLKVIGVDSE